jgi:3-oxoacyl-[acyl-carrier protein] reductase
MNEQRIALVTGGGSGFGAAISRRLAKEGYHVAVNDLTEGSASAVASEVGGETAPFDVSISAAVDAAVDALVARHGRIDLVVNNAGIAPNRPDVSERGMANMARMMAGEPLEPAGATSTLSEEAWDRMIRVHLYGTFYCTRAALRHMEPARRGAIVNLASIAGLQSIPGAPDYSAAKGGIVTFTRSVGREVAPLGIRVNAIAPAYFDTPLLSDITPEQRAMTVMRHPVGRLGHAEELAEMVAWLASDAASFCFGEVQTITGGFN